MDFYEFASQQSLLLLNTIYTSIDALGYITFESRVDPTCRDTRDFAGATPRLAQRCTSCELSPFSPDFKSDHRAITTIFDMTPSKITMANYKRRGLFGWQMSSPAFLIDITARLCKTWYGRCGTDVESFSALVGRCARNHSYRPPYRNDSVLQYLAEELKRLELRRPHLREEQRKACTLKIGRLRLYIYVAAVEL